MAVGVCVWVWAADTVVMSAIKKVEARKAAEKQLLQACHKGDVEKAEEMIAKGARANSCDEVRVCTTKPSSSPLCLFPLATLLASLSLGTFYLAHCTPTPTSLPPHDTHYSCIARRSW